MIKILISILDFLLNWLPVVVPWLILAAAALRYFFGNHSWPFLKFLSFRNLIMTAIGWRLLDIFLSMIGQYYLWSQSAFTKFFLKAPLSREIILPFWLKAFPGFFQGPLGYFLFYSYGRFWLDFLLALVTASVFYLFLKILKRYQDRFFLEGEIELGFLTALLAGWPNVLVFVPLVFVFVFLLSLGRLIFLKAVYTPLGLPFLTAVLATFVFGNVILNWLQLGFYKI